MTPVTIARGLWWCGCLLVLLNAGCARWGYKHAEKQNIDRALSDDEASFVETPLARTQPIPPPGAKAVERTPEDEALIDDTLARLRTLPDMPPEKVDSIAKELRNPTSPLPRMMLQQINAMAKFEQEKAQQKAAAKTAALADVNASTPTAETQPAETKPAATPTAEAKPVEAKPAEVAAPATLANPAQPVVQASATAPAPAAAVTPAATTAPPADTKTASSAAAEPVEPTSDTPISAPSRSLRDRLRKARESTTPSEDRTIFDGKVGANLPPQLDPDQFAVAHVTHKPATLANTAASASASAEAEALAWDKHLAQAIEGLEAELESGALDTADAARLATQLRLLYLVAERKEDALRAIDELETHQQEYWRSQLHSLSLSLATDGTPVKGRRAALALRPLREAVDHLASGATLDVKNVALCKSVSMWGNYTEFDEYTFKPNQEVLLYFEVENFASESTSKGYATEFVSSYEIFDETGRRVAEQQFPTAQETCQNRRRDYFIRYHLHMPKMLTSGDYTLQLTVEDQKGHKFGQGSVKFKVSG